MEAEKNGISARMGDICLEVVDGDGPYLTGSVGIAVRDGSHISCREIRIKAAQAAAGSK